MISADQVTGIVVTRGDVPLGRVCEPLIDADLRDVLVYDNSLDENLAVYGRYAAIENTDTPAILVVDDDVALSQKAIFTLLAAYEPGKLVANMPQEQQARYPDSPLVGFGAIFDRALPGASFAKFTDAICEGPPYDPHPNGAVPEDVFNRTCDLIFATLTPFTLVDEPFEYLPWTWDDSRMFRQEGNTEERQRMLALARKVRDSSQTTREA